MENPVEPLHYMYGAALPVCEYYVDGAATYYGKLRLDHIGHQCWRHERARLPRLCAQLLCITYLWETRREPLSDNHSLQLPCGTEAGGKLTKLSFEGHPGTGCYRTKGWLYRDIDRQASQMLLDIAVQGWQKVYHMLPHQVGTWTHHLGEMWWLYQFFFSQAVGSVLSRWPRFRFPPWLRDIDRASVALRQVVSMVHSEQAPRRVTFVESGVFLANSSSELIEELSHMLADVYLVDPWDCNPTMQEALKWQGLSSASTGDYIIQEVRKKMIALSGVAVCDGGITHDGLACYSDHMDSQHRVRVHLHRASSRDAALRFAPESLDVVFVDGSHVMEDVRDDLSAWWPTIRPGGVLMGHDFSSLHPGVGAALVEFVTRTTEAPEVFLDADTTFWLRKDWT